VKLNKNAFNLCLLRLSGFLFGIDERNTSILNVLNIKAEEMPQTPQTCVWLLLIILLGIVLIAIIATIILISMATNGNQLPEDIYATSIGQPIEESALRASCHSTLVQMSIPLANNHFIKTNHKI
jgi:hypothetical protein